MIYLATITLGYLAGALPVGFLVAKLWRGEGLLD